MTQTYDKLRVETLEMCYQNTSTKILALIHLSKNQDQLMLILGCGNYENKFRCAIFGSAVLVDK